MMKRTKIIATVGPGVGSRKKLRALVEAGVDVFRINFSHGDEAQRGEFLQHIRAVEHDAGRLVAICGDLCGPKIRVGMMQGGEVELAAGREIVMQRRPIEGTADRMSTTLPELVDVVRPGERILLADGRLRFEVIKTSPPEDFTCRVVVGGPLSSGKGVNLPETELPMSALTEKDRQDLRWIAQYDFDYVALSFVQRAEDVDELRRLLDEHGSRAHIIAKIEKPQALDQIDAIIDTVDAVMVARGDLGVEMDFPAVPIVQKTIAHKCRVAGKPCIIATEMLESMISSPRPTRAEVSDVANAVFDHADAVMLSAESSIGQYPVEAVDAMHRVVVAAEAFLEQENDTAIETLSDPLTTAALTASVRQVMRLQQIAAIALFTASGTTARLLAKNRPPCPILTLASQPSVARRTCLYYGVVPYVVDLPESPELLLRQSARVLQDLHLATSGDRIIVLGGHPVGAEGGTKILILEEIT
ncbi:Pyruvate kinase [Candidatus Entotheonellaceae bacterium PAL068K]